jgi:hypothetical protein
MGLCSPKVFRGCVDIRFLSTQNRRVVDPIAFVWKVLISGRDGFCPRIFTDAHGF